MENVRQFVDLLPPFLERHVGISPSIRRIQENRQLPIWSKIWNKKLMATFEKHFNLHGGQKSIRNLFICLLHMALLPRHNMQDYWRADEYGDAFVKRYFRTYIEFASVLHSLRVTNDNDFDPLNLFWKIQPFIDHLNQTYSSSFTPSQLIDADEHGIPFKGTFVAKQYMKDKPYKWLIKVWMLNDAATGYISRFIFYPGNNARVPPNVREAHRPTEVVMRLLPTSLNDKGYVVVADNYYGSISLLERLADRGFYGLMTMRVTRQHFPRNVVLTNNRCRRGDVKLLSAPGRNHSRMPLFACSLKDKRVVNLASTIPPKVSLLMCCKYQN